jgi:hypothetical protein
MTEKDLLKATFLLYKENVKKISEKNFKYNFLNNKNLRSADWHLDHKVSITECYANKVPEYIAGHICNLEIISKHENLSKGAKSSMTVDDLYKTVIEHDDFFS